MSNDLRTFKIKKVLKIFHHKTKKLITLFMSNLQISARNLKNSMYFGAFLIYINGTGLFFRIVHRSWQTQEIF